MDALTPIWNGIIIDPMTNTLLFLYSLVQNYGVAIIVFTILIGLLTMPLRIKSQTAMKAQQAKTARIQPRLDEIKKKHKNDPQALQQAQMKLYQEEGLVNPLNSGCLLTLLPFPIFIGLYSVVTSVMGSTPESLLQLSQHLYSFFPNGGQLIPVRPDFLGLNLAAIPSQAYGLVHPVTILIVLLVVGSSWVQQKIMTPATAALDPQQAAMNNQMQLITPVIFGFFVVNAPIGLSFYWITFGLMTIVQQVITGGTSSLRNLIPGQGPKNAKKPPVKRISAPKVEDTEEAPAPVKPLPSMRSAANKPQPKKVGKLTMIDTEDTGEDRDGSGATGNGDQDRQAAPDSRRATGGPKKGKKKRGK